MGVKRIVSSDKNPTRAQICEAMVEVFLGEYDVELTFASRGEDVTLRLTSLGFDPQTDGRFVTLGGDLFIPELDQWLEQRTGKYDTEAREGSFEDVKTST